MLIFVGVSICLAISTVLAYLLLVSFTENTMQREVEGSSYNIVTTWSQEHSEVKALATKLMRQHSQLTEAHYTEIRELYERLEQKKNEARLSKERLIKTLGET